MATLTSIYYDKNNKRYLIRMQDSTGMLIQYKRTFATYDGAKRFIERYFKEHGFGDVGEAVPLVRN